MARGWWALITILQLEYFTALARSENISLSAMELNVSRSSVSSALKLLEDELGVQLFDRVGRNIRLNTYGREFLPYAQDMLASLDEGRNRLTSLSKEREGIVRFSAPDLSIYTSQSDEFLRLYSRYSIEQIELDVGMNPQLLWEKDLDFMLTSYSLGSDYQVLGREIAYQPDVIVLAVSPESELARRTHCSLDDLADQVIIFHNESGAFQETIDDVFEQNGFVPKKTHTMDEFSLAAMVRRSYGVAFATDVVMSYVDYYQGLVPVYVDEFSGRTASTRAYWRNDRPLTPAAKDVIDTICSIANSIRDEMNARKNPR